MGENIRFRIGDRVVAIDKVDHKPMAGMEGTVVSVSPARVGVDFDKCFPGGHNCDGKGRSGHCRWGLSSEFDIINDTPLDLNTLEIGYEDII